MKTKLGIFLKKLRIDHDEILMDMALKLGVSAAFLSYVENGKKVMPEGMFDKICNLYEFTPEQRSEFEMAVAESNQFVKVDLQHVCPVNRELAVVFARTFENMSEEESKQMLEFLKKRGKKN